MVQFFDKMLLKKPKFFYLYLRRQGFYIPQPGGVQSGLSNGMVGYEHFIYPPPCPRYGPVRKKCGPNGGCTLDKGGKINTNLSRRCEKVRSEWGVYLGQGRALNKGGGGTLLLTMRKIKADHCKRHDYISAEDAFV